jgi:hypothetical protein
MLDGCILLLGPSNNSTPVLEQKLLLPPLVGPNPEALAFYVETALRCVLDSMMGLKAVIWTHME